jgi:hypothetical protein
MGLILTQINGNEFEVDNLRFLRSEKSFIASNSTSKDSLEFKYSLKPDDKFKTKETDFEVFLFHNDNLATNDIFEIKTAGQRLGWLFPIQALLSSEHDHAENDHFFPYSYNAYRILLKNKCNLPYKKPSSNSATLEELYGENTIIFIVYRKYLKAFKTKLGIQFSIDDYLLFFYQYGFTLLSSTNFISLYDLKVENLVPKKFESGVIELDRISKDLLNDKPYLNSLIQGLIKLERHPLVKFHLLYSVIELFISKIFESDFKSSLENFLVSTDFYDAKEKLAKMTNEKGRINKLFSVSCPGLDAGLLSDLEDASNTFLSLVFAPKVFKKGVGEAIYKVRSTIFHNLRHMPAGYENSLADVLQKLEVLILDISMKIKLS